MTAKNTDPICTVDSHKRISADPAEQRIRELEKKNAELKHANKILQKALVFLHNAKEVRAHQSYQFIFEKHHGNWTMKLVCRILCVSVSDYYKYCRNLSKPNKDIVLSATI